MHVNAAVTLPRDRTCDVVTDSQRAKAFAPAFTERAECVCSFAALADGEHQRLGGNGRITMTKLARIFDFGGNIREPLDQIFPHPAGMQGRAATHKNNAPDIA